MTDAVATTEATTNDAAVEKVELTLEQKLEQAEARVAKLKQQLLTQSMLSNVEKDDKVTIKFGRADKVRHIEGTVVAVAIPNVVVLGNDLETFKVNVRDIVANPTAEARSGGVQNVDEINPVTGVRPEEAGGTPAPEVDAADIARLEGEGGIVADNSADPLENA